MLIRNAIYAFVEKIISLGAQLVVTVLLVRALSIETYALLGAAAGIAALVGLFNVSFEAQIIRDHAKWDPEVGARYHLAPYFIMAVLRVIGVFLAAMLLKGFFAPSGYEATFAMAVIAILIPLSVDILSAPISVYTSCQVKQEIVAKATIFRSVMNIAGTSVLLLRPSLEVLVLKECAVGSIYLLAWIYIGSQTLERGAKKLGMEGLPSRFVAILRDAQHYSLWIHGNGVVTNLVYRSHTLILAKFAPLAEVGAYTVALNCANTANIVPALLGSQQSIVLAKAKDRAAVTEICRNYGAVAILLAGLMVLAFVFLGPFYVRIVMGRYSDVTYEYMLWISLSLIFVKTFASPAIAYLNIYGSPRRIVIRIALPLLLLSTGAYIAGSYIGGGEGLAIANLVVSGIWLALVAAECKPTGYEVSGGKDVWRVVRIGIRRIGESYGKR